MVTRSRAAAPEAAAPAPARRSREPWLLHRTVSSPALPCGAETIRWSTSPSMGGMLPALAVGKCSWWTRRWAWRQVQWARWQGTARSLERGSNPWIAMHLVGHGQAATRPPLLPLQPSRRQASTPRRRQQLRADEVSGLLANRRAKACITRAAAAGALLDRAQVASQGQMPRVLLHLHRPALRQPRRARGSSRIASPACQARPSGQQQGRRRPSVMRGMASVLSSTGTIQPSLGQHGGGTRPWARLPSWLPS